jgi:N-acetylglutamate synthase
VHEDYDEVRARWERSTGIGLNESETREAIGLFLTRNPGLSLVVLAPKVQWRVRC